MPGRPCLAPARRTTSRRRTTSYAVVRRCTTSYDERRRTTSGKTEEDELKEKDVVSPQMLTQELGQAEEHDEVQQKRRKTDTKEQHGRPQKQLG